jgi:hypothetical protein
MTGNQETPFRFAENGVLHFLTGDLSKMKNQDLTSRQGLFPKPVCSHEMLSVGRLLGEGDER